MKKHFITLVDILIIAIVIFTLVTVILGGLNELSGNKEQKRTLNLNPENEHANQRKKL